MLITNNLSSLTAHEKQLIATAKSFEYAYKACTLFVHLESGEMIFWECSNTTAAKMYLEKQGVKELTKK